MPNRTSTGTTGDILHQLDHPLRPAWSRPADMLPEVAANGDVRIRSYTPVLRLASSWLSVVEQRIRASVRPDEYESENDESTEWLNGHAAAEAIRFFQQVADLLPAEPHISATIAGDLVAEFQTPACHMTSVISDTKTILFGVTTSDPDRPVQAIIRRGSNRLRDDLKSFTLELNPVSNGKKMGAAR